MGGIVIYEVLHSSTAQQDQEATKQIDALTVPRGEIITSLAQLNDIEVKISEHEIKDFSKADVITKAFAISQCTWLTVQCVARGAQGYAISQLELGTLGFILCAFIMHIFWWYKPFDVESRRVLPRLPQSGTPCRLRLFLSMDDLTEFNLELSQQRMGEMETNGDGRFMYDIAHPEASTAEKLTSSTLYLTVIGFTVIHLLAWNWEFPAPLVQQLWRWFNIGAAAISILPVALVSVCSILDPRHTFVSSDGFTIFIVAVGILYALIRLGVLGLTFYCLSSMPERAYTIMNWLAWIPHFS